jgi:hypothetical protein
MLLKQGSELNSDNLETLDVIKYLPDMPCALNIGNMVMQKIALAFQVSQK